MCEQYRYDLQLFVFVTASLTATSFVRGTQSTGALTPCFTKSEDNNVTVHSITGKWVEAPHILDQSDADSDITCRIGNGGPRSCAVQARKRREGAGHSFPLSSKAGVPRLVRTISRINKQGADAGAQFIPHQIIHSWHPDQRRLCHFQRVEAL